MSKFTSVNNPRKGRPKGSINKDRKSLHELVTRLGINPFEVLLRLAAEDWKGLGYPARTETKFTAAGIEFEEYVISPELRGKCAGQACEYLHAKRKAIEQTINPDLIEAFQSLEGMSDDELRAIVLDRTLK